MPFIEQVPVQHTYITYKEVLKCERTNCVYHSGCICQLYEDQQNEKPDWLEDQHQFIKRPKKRVKLTVYCDEDGKPQRTVCYSYSPRITTHNLY